MPETLEVLPGQRDKHLRKALTWIAIRLMHFIAWGAGPGLLYPLVLLSQWQEVREKRKGRPVNGH